MRSSALPAVEAENMPVASVNSAPRRLKEVRAILSPLFVGLSIPSKSAGSIARGNNRHTFTNINSFPGIAPEG